MSDHPIPLIDLAACHKEVDDELAELWRDLVPTGRFVGGPVVDRFEDEFARYCGRSRCIGVGNGTDAIELVLAGLDIGPGDEVVVPANGFIATPEAVVRVGATPVFADVDPDTYLVTAATVAEVLTPATAAVIVVHLYGQLPDMDALGALAERHGLALIEDAAQAHGAAWRGRPAGSFGAAAAFSFYPTKNLGALGDGGAVVTDDLALEAKVRTLTNHGRPPRGHHRHEVIGRNSRLDAVQAGVLSVKLRHLDRWNDQRRRVSAWYRSRLRGSGCTPVHVAPEASSVHYLEVLTVDDPLRVGAALADRGIESGFHYPVPCHRQPPYSGYARGALPVAENAADHVISVPMYPSLTERQVDRVCRALVEATPWEAAS